MGIKEWHKRLCEFFSSDWAAICLSHHFTGRVERFEILVYGEEHTSLVSWDEAYESALKGKAACIIRQKHKT